jgi:hypothetical protein
MTRLERKKTHSKKEFLFKNSLFEIQMKIFTRGTNFKLRETSDTFYMFLDSDVVDFQ